MKHTTHNTNSAQRGFTMIELVVSMGVFLVAAMISATAIISIMDGNRRAQAAKSAINNVNFALDSMSRALRVGTDYRCENGVATECMDFLEEDGSAVNSAVTFTSSDGEEITYAYDDLGKAITRSIDGGLPLAMTAPNVEITSAIFGVGRRVQFLDEDNGQPRVVIIVRGRSGQGDEEVAFDVQTTVTQRVFGIE